MKKMKIILSLGLAAVLFSCGEKGMSSLRADELLEGYVATNTSVVAYGAVDYNNIVNKSDAKNLPMYGDVLSSTLDTFNLALPEDARIYFAVENSDTTDGLPADKGVLILDVKDHQKLVDQIVNMSFTNLSEEEDLSIFVSDNQVIAITPKMAVAFVEKDEIMEPVAYVKDFFAKNKNKSKQDIAHEVLADDSDIVFCTKPDAMYVEAAAFSKDVTVEQKKMTLMYMKDAQFKTSVRFEEGQGVITTKAYVNDELKNALFLNTNDNEAIFEKLGAFEANMGICINIDVDKMDKFAKTIDPNYMNKILAQSDVSPLVSILLSSNKLNTFINGKFTAVAQIAGKADSLNYVSAYAGVGESMMNLLDNSKDLWSSEVKETAANEFLIGKNQKVYKNDDFLMYKKGVNGNFPEGKVTVPEWAKGFGSKPVTAFVDINALPEDIKVDLDDAEFMVDALDHIYMEADNLESRIVIKAKKGQENVLKQLLESFMAANGL
ncbi:hypothetical protein SAMN05216474_2202 [Lishizhenia tianjinensis]|uniref:DUF4836 domain-containing protein n=1 Tax=Lishizhenia tianjinensis TaxID=477690 RepID=A0A1I7ALG5_9FLAO|nr:hypothetical protein [Lishizhenia tianjinensis]SFT75743.1 hypothetical protein SAMN05216474_2202 [Lishizhenia tianjinensis]